MACCTMCTVLVSTTKLPNDQLTIWWFGNRTKYTRHRTTSHLTVDIWRSSLVSSQDLWVMNQVYDLQSLSPLNRWYKIRFMRLKKGEWAILALAAITIGILLAAPAPEASPRLVSVQRLPDAVPMCEWNETGGAGSRLIASLGQ